MCFVVSALHSMTIRKSETVLEQIINSGYPLNCPFLEAFLSNLSIRAESLFCSSTHKFSPLKKPAFSRRFLTIDSVFLSFAIMTVCKSIFSQQLFPVQSLCVRRLSETECCAGGQTPQDKAASAVRSHDGMS